MERAFDDSNPPDWTRLEEIDSEAQSIFDAGKMTQDEFERIWKIGEKARNGHPEFMDSFVCYAEEG